MSSGDRTQRGFVPNYRPGQYPSQVSSSSEKSIQQPSNKEGSTGRNSGGETGKPVPVSGRDDD